MARVLDGEVIPTTIDEYRTQLQNSWQEILGEDFVLGDQTVQGQIIGLIANALATQDEVIISTNNGARLETAIGAQLDHYGLLLGINRNNGSRSTASVVFSGNPGTIIPVNSRVRARNGTIFVTFEGETTIGVDGMSGETQVRTPNVGSFQAAAGEIDSIVDSAVGLTGVTNSAAATPGVDPETDSEYRARLLRSKVVTPGTALGLRSAILSIPAVTEAIVFANDTNMDGPERQGITIPAGSILCGVLGGSDEDIGRVILANKSLGVPTFGTESVDVQILNDPITTTVNFSRITETEIKISAAVTRDLALFPPNGLDQIISNIYSYLTGLATPLTVGQGVDPNAFIGFIYDIDGATLSGSITVTDTDDNALPTITPLLTIYRITRENISIVAA